MKYLTLSLAFFCVIFFFCKEGSSYSDITTFVSKEKEESKKTSHTKESQKKIITEIFEEKNLLSSYALENFEEKSLEHYERKKQVLSEKPLVSKDILEDEENLLLAHKTLLSLEWVFSFSRENQAYMRILALDIIKEEAKKNGSYMLKDMINKLLQKWDKNKNYPGASQDIVELIIGLVEQEGKEEIYKDPSQLFSSLNYDKKYKTIFSRALANLYPETVPNSNEARKIIKILEGLE